MPSPHPFRLLLALLVAAAPIPALSQAADDLTVLPADDLRPGQYVWQPERAPAGEVQLVVSVPQQKIYVFRGGVPIGAASVSTGKRGHGTPAGSFTILQKAVNHRSNLYSNAPMPFMQRLTWDGIAIHAGHNPGRPASHGCVRVPRAFARLLYDATVLGASVVITHDAPASAEAALYALPDAAPAPALPIAAPVLRVPPVPRVPPAFGAAPVQPHLPVLSGPPPLPAPPMLPEPDVSPYDDMVSYTVPSTQ